MTLELYREIALTRDLPEYELKAGDVATIVDFGSHPLWWRGVCVRSF